MKVKMLKTIQGSPNGYIIETYYKDEVYNIPDKLYQAFKKLNVIKDFVEIDKQEIKPKKEEKNILNSPMNKALNKSTNNKSKDDINDNRK
jgi:hypothetical protein